MVQLHRLNWLSFKTLFDHDVQSSTIVGKTMVKLHRHNWLSFKTLFDHHN